MNREKIEQLLNEFIDEEIESLNIIDSSKPSDYRLNCIINRKYVLRINDPIINEQRLEEISRLVERYNESGIAAPSLIRSRQGTYLISAGDKVAYLSEYLDHPTLSEYGHDDGIFEEVLSSIGAFAQKNRNVDLIDTRSMWSIIDLAPLDKDIDEKQENLNALTEVLEEYDEKPLADKLMELNNTCRSKIGEVFSELPRCVIQGDLNDSNILIKDGHFHGLIDFNMAGTEVIINQFCCESDEIISEEDFVNRSAEELYLLIKQKEEHNLNVILKEYELNDIEKEVVDYYRTICRISQYPNVCAYKEYLIRDKEKICSYLEQIVNDFR